MLTTIEIMVRGYKIGDKVLLNDVFPAQIDEIVAFYEKSDNKPGYDVWLKEFGDFSLSCIEPLPIYAI